MSEPPPMLPLLERAILEPVVRAALCRPAAEVGDWKITTLSRQGGRTVYRVQGTAADPAGPQPWTVILKVLRTTAPDGAGEAPATGWAYWKREALVYRSGLVADLPGGLMAPCCYGVQERSAREVWIWMEALVESDPGPWPLARYGLAARHLGAFNGAYLAGRPLPTAPWLSRDWLSTRTAARAPQLAAIRDPATWAHPLLRHGFSQPVVSRIEALWAERDALLAVRARLSQTFCHLDAWRGNLLARGTPAGAAQTVAFDWAFAGYAALGEEIAPLVWVCPLEFLVEPAAIAELEDSVFAGYLAGLRAAGWHGDPRQVRLGYLANALLQWGLFPEALSYVLDPAVGPAASARYGRPLQDLVDCAAAVTYALLDRVAEARRLLAALG